MKSETKVTLHFDVTTDADGLFTAICREIPGLLTCAESRERLGVPMLRDAVIGWFETLRKLGLYEQTMLTLDADPAASTVTFSVKTTEGQEIRYEQRAAS